MAENLETITMGTTTDFQTLDWNGTGEGDVTAIESESLEPKRENRVNVGAIGNPFSGVGMEFEPLYGKVAETNLVIHEVGYEDDNCDWNFASAFSPFWRIYCDFKPGHRVRFGDCETLMNPDQVLVIPSFQRFTCSGDEPVPSLWVAFSLERSVAPNQTMPIIIPKNDTTTAFLEEFREIFCSQRQDRRKAVYQLGISYVMYILAQPEIKWRAPLPEPIANVLTLIQKDPAASWSNSILAREAHMSTVAFTRLFRQWTQDTPANYVQRMRIRKACAMLAGSDLPIKQIAIEVGFTNRHHFSRVFKARTNISPARYRKEIPGS